MGRGVARLRLYNHIVCFASPPPPSTSQGDEVDEDDDPEMPDLQEAQGDGVPVPSVAELYSAFTYLRAVSVPEIKDDVICALYRYNAYNLGHTTEVWGVCVRQAL